MNVSGILKGEKREIEIGNADIGKWILETLKSKPDFVGQADPVSGEKSKYGTMSDESIRCASWLRKQGLKPGDVVCTITHNHLSNYIPIFATFYNRAAYSAWNCGLYPQMIEYLLNLLKPKFIFAEEREVDKLLKVAKEINLETKVIAFTKMPGVDSLEDILRESTSQEVDHFCCTVPTNADDDCLFMLTSGTSGDMSKVVQLSYKSVFHGLKLYVDEMEKGTNVMLNFLTLAWSYALIKMLISTLSFTRWIVVNEISYDLQEAFRYIQDYKVTHVCFGLGMIHRLHKLREPIKYDISSVKNMEVGGMKHSTEVMKMLIQVTKNGQVEHSYGATECVQQFFRGIMNNIDLNSCGRLLPNVESKVIDVKTGEILGPNEKGEFCFKSPSMMKGYFKNQKATDEVIDSEGWYHSGDLGFYDESGLGFLHGRVKNMSIHEGKFIPIWDIERVLYMSSEVADVATVAIGSSNDLELFVFVTVITDSKVTENELEEMVKSLSTVSEPLTVKIVDELPMSPRGKIKINDLKKIAENLKNGRNM